MKTLINFSNKPSEGTLTLGEGDVETLVRLAEIIDQDASTTAMAFGYTACVTCISSGETHTINALNYVHALAKAAGKCRGSFQMSTGPC